MVHATQIRIIVGIAAAIWFAIALFSESGGEWTALRTVSIAGTAITMLFLAYERWIWRWKAVRYFTGKPDLNGTWRGELHSDFERDGKRIDPIPTVVRIHQTNSQIVVTQFTGESTSLSELAELKKLSDGRYCALFTYTNTPRPGVRNRSDIHTGLCDLNISGDSNSLSGGYFTSRKTTGDIWFTEWSKRKYGDAQSALEADTFTTPAPFAKEQ